MSDLRSGRVPGNTEVLREFYTHCDIGAENSSITAPDLTWRWAKLVLLKYGVVIHEVQILEKFLVPPTRMVASRGVGLRICYSDWDLWARKIIIIIYVCNSYPNLWSVSLVPQIKCMRCNQLVSSGLASNIKMELLVSLEYAQHHKLVLPSGKKFTTIQSIHCLDWSSFLMYGM